MIDDFALSEALHTSAPVIPLGDDAIDELRSVAIAVGEVSRNTRRRRLRQLVAGVVLAALVSGGATAAYATGALEPFFADAPFQGDFSDVTATATASATPSNSSGCTLQVRAASYSGGHRATLHAENRYLSTLTLKEVRASSEYRALKRDALSDYVKVFRTHQGRRNRTNPAELWRRIDPFSFTAAIAPSRCGRRRLVGAVGPHPETMLRGSGTPTRGSRHGVTPAVRGPASSGRRCQLPRGVPA
jgi:hypothetical protein